MKKLYTVLLPLVIFCGCSTVNVGRQSMLVHKTLNGVIGRDTLWEGYVTINDDILVPAGVTLTIKEGCTIYVKQKTLSRVSPQFISEKTEIHILGSLLVNGTPEKRTVFLGKQKEWAGIILRNGASLNMSYANIQGAETALYVLGGEAELNNVKFTGNRAGIIVQGSGSVLAKRSWFIKNDKALAVFGGKLRLEDSLVEHNTEMGVWRGKNGVIELRMSGVYGNTIDFYGFNVN